MGEFCYFPDILINEILTFLGVEELCKIGICNRFLWALSNQNDLWKMLVEDRVISSFPPGGWKELVLEREVGVDKISLEGVHSSLLFLSLKSRIFPSSSHLPPISSLPTHR